MQSERIKILQFQANELKNQLAPITDKIRVIEREEERKRLQNLAEKCFIYKDNCFSCPSSLKDYWDVYYKILDVTNNNCLMCLEFQTNKYGHITIEMKPILKECLENDKKIISITKEEFEKEFAKVLNKIKEAK